MGKQFRNDYSELAHPRILKALSDYSNEQNEAYGLDYHSKNAANYIKKIFGAPNSDVYFIAGGTQTNLLMISYILKHYEGVISADTGHINVHETAAIEGSGYKIITINNYNGKIKVEDILEKIIILNNEHMVKPKMVYVSNSTELGTIYSKQELEKIYDFCRKNGLYFYIDGARLGSALTSKYNDIKLEDMGSLCDAFYIGGTKNGLLFGEALVINNSDLKEDFRYHIKNKGAMLAKGYAVGIQFEEAFKDGLYFELAKKANDAADTIKEGFKQLNIKMIDSPTNQIFATFKNEEAELYMKTFGSEFWNDDNEKNVTIRFVTSFLTTQEDINYLLDFIKQNH